MYSLCKDLSGGRDHRKGKRSTYDQPREVLKVRRLHGKMPVRRDLQRIREGSEDGKCEFKNQWLECNCTRRFYDPRGSAGGRDPYPHTVLLKRDQRDRRMPYVRGGSKRRKKSGGGMRSPGFRRNGSADQYPEAA